MTSLYSHDHFGFIFSGLSNRIIRKKISHWRLEPVYTAPIYPETFCSWRGPRGRGVGGWLVTRGGRGRGVIVVRVREPVFRNLPQSYTSPLKKQTTNKKKKTKKHKKQLKTNKKTKKQNKTKNKQKKKKKKKKKRNGPIHILDRLKCWPCHILPFDFCTHLLLVVRQIS